MSEDATMGAMTQATTTRRPRLWLWVIIVLVVVGLAIGGVLIAGQLAANAAEQRHRETLAEVMAYWQANPAPKPLAPITDPEPGQALWRMQIPQLWGEGSYAVVAGTDADHLKGALGWYLGGAQPGQVGNFAVAGHCLVDGGAFAGLIDLPTGSEIVVETRDARFTYELLSPASELTVTDSDSWVLEPVPGQPDRIATHALLTLTTCEDTVPTADRLVAFGVLTATEMK